MENDDQNRDLQQSQDEQLEDAAPPIDQKSDSPPEQSTPHIEPTQLPTPAYDQESPKSVGKSLKGLGGALVFWLIALGLGGLAWLWTFFSTLASSFGSSYRSSGIMTTETVTFSIILAGLYIGTLVAIVLTKKIGVLLAYGSIAVTALYATIMTITHLATYDPCPSSFDRDYSMPTYCDPSLDPEEVIFSIGGIILAWVAAGLVALYFWHSQRVKQTLVN
jgi:hypothetical protein